MGTWIKSKWLEADVGPGVRESRETGAAVSKRRLVKLDSDQKIVQATSGDRPAGISTKDEEVLSGESVAVAFSGEAQGKADLETSDGDWLKCGDDGTLTPWMSPADAYSTIGSGSGGGFSNQPSNDTVQVLSDDAADDQTVVIFGTTNGGTTVVKEEVVLNGTTPVDTSKSDWGEILGWHFKIGSPTASGTVTLQEKSGGLDIDTIASGTRYSGVIKVGTDSRRGFLRRVRARADSATTKVVGLVGTDTSGSEQLEAFALTGASDVRSTKSFRTITHLLVGDLEGARTATYRRDKGADALDLRVGFALSKAEAGTDCSFLFWRRALPLLGSKQLWKLSILGTWGVDVDGARTNGAGLLCDDPSLTEQIGRYAVVSDGGTVARLDASGGEAGYTANYQLMPDSPADGDFVAFGDDSPFPEFALDIGTAETYIGEGLTWEYYGEAGWATLTLAYDGTGSTAQDGKRSFQRDGAITFVPPEDWTATTLDGTEGYWIRAKVTTQANLGTSAITNSVNHELVVPEDPFEAPHDAVITQIRVADAASTLHAANPVKFIVHNFTTHESSDELSWSVSKRTDKFQTRLAVSEGDQLGVICVAEDGLDEPADVELQLTASLQ